MNKPLKVIPPTQAEVLYDQALREDAFWAKSQNKIDASDWAEAMVWDDDEPDTDRRPPVLLTMGSARR